MGALLLRVERMDCHCKEMDINDANVPESLRNYRRRKIQDGLIRSGAAQRDVAVANKGDPAEIVNVPPDIDDEFAGADAIAH